jgi:putative flippase GtrA
MVTQLIRFAAVGAISTIAYLAIFVVLRAAVSAQAANLIALLVTAVANTAVNRRLTFGIRGRVGAARAQLQGLVAFGLGLGLSSSALGLLHLRDPRPSRTAEVCFLVAANVLATLLRFVLFRTWVFRAGSQRTSGDAFPQMETAE